MIANISVELVGDGGVSEQLGHCGFFLFSFTSHRGNKQIDIQGRPVSCSVLFVCNADVERKTSQPDVHSAFFAK